MSTSERFFGGLPAAPAPDGSSPGAASDGLHRGILAKHWRSAVLCGVALGVLLFQWLARAAAEFQAQDVGLGRNTLPTFATDEGERISGPFESMDELLETFRGRRAAGRRIVLWLGASQLYALNQARAEDHLAVWYAADRARARGADDAYVMAANPNCNPVELFASYLMFRQAGLVPDVLVVGFTYDDLKEPGVRALAFEHLEPLDPASLPPPAAEAVAAIEDARRALGAANAQAPVERSAVAGTAQERLERALVDALDAHWPAYAERGRLQAAAVAAWKVPFTALAFRVFTRPKRLVPAEQQRWNEAGLLALFETAAADGVPVLVYQAPLRPAEDPDDFYHDRAAYDAYHAHLAELLHARGMEYLDLETLVDAEFWGMTNDGSPDVFHFRDEGHRRLGLAIDQWLEEHGF